MHKHWPSSALLTLVVLILSFVPAGSRCRPIRPTRAGTAAAALSAPAGGSACSGDGVYLYEDTNYGGACLKWMASDPELGDDGWHDRASSIKLVGTYACSRPTLYEHANYAGASATFSHEDAWLGDDAIGNDRADSLKIEWVSICDCVTEIPKAECRALVSLYNQTDGPHWRDRDGWLEHPYPCSWDGVTCAWGHVTALQLADNELLGSLPENLGDLTYLVRLSLGWNLLFGNLPATLGGLSQLQVLALHDNGLTGAFPPGLGSLSHLTRIYLQNNQLTGGIPASLGGLLQLEELDLSSNHLDGSIPSELGQLSSLRRLILSDNRLSGSIPGTLGNLSSLQSLGLDVNQLSGAIPSTLGNLANLEILYLEWNRLSGSIPDSLGQLAKVWMLSLAGNELSGSVPSVLGTMPALYVLYINDNPLSGALPRSLMNRTFAEFFFQNTGLCEPRDGDFQAWLNSIPLLLRTGVLCPEATSTPTATRTLTHTPTATRTPTYTPTRIPGGLLPLYLPLVLKDHPRPPTCPELLVNGDFETGALPPWGTFGPVGVGAGRLSTSGAWLGGQNSNVSELFQVVTIPAGADLVQWSFWWKPEVASAQPGDHLLIRLEYQGGDAEFVTLPAEAPLNQWRKHTVDLTPYAGQWVRIGFLASTDDSTPTTFRVDGVSVTACGVGAW